MTSLICNIVLYTRMGCHIYSIGMKSVHAAIKIHMLYILHFSMRRWGGGGGGLRFETLSENANIMLHSYYFCVQFSFASNAATIVGGCLVSSQYKLRIPAAFVSAFVISVSVCI